MSTVLGGYTLESTFRELAFAPFQHSELLPTLIPLIFGAVVIELYFGKYTQEELGWNTSVGNAVIWATTGLTLLMTTKMSSQQKFVAYALLGLGGLVGYMDFNHKWSDSVAFIVSSSGIVYTLAYIAVVMIKTSMPVTQTTLKGAGAFLVITMIGFKFLQGLETSRDQGLAYS